MAMKVLIVDDEPIARDILREELEAIGNIEIAGEADSGLGALELIAQHAPDMVLLDLQMPGMGGLDVVRQLKHGAHVPAVVIVTAYDKFAIQAFEAGAIDYLLKPVRQERLAEAVERARRISGRRALEKIAALQELPDQTASLGSPSGVGSPSGAAVGSLSGSTQPVRKIVGRAGEEYFLLRADEILAFQAEGALVWIVTAKRKYLATQPLKSLQERLLASNFRRIHRNALINVEHVRKMSVLSSQRWLVTLSNGQEFIASKRLGQAVRQLAQW
jgi:DNA-binding LytR/AlgR family response regulator